MADTDFTHLHVHSEYSLLDGACRVKDLVATAAGMGMKSLAITDHGNMFGVIHFYKAARDGGIKPIIGYEAYTTPFDLDVKTAEASKAGLWHLTLLAKDITGFRSLIQLASIASVEGFYYKPRLNKKVLAEHSEGLICLSGCLHSEINQHLLAGNASAAEQAAKDWIDIFGQENVYIELQDNSMQEQKDVLGPSVEIARRLGLPMVATNDIHYLNRDDAYAHEALLCINTQKKLDDEDRMRFSSDEFYFKSSDEMAERFAEWPEAIASTAQIAERCNVELELGKIILPGFDAPDGMDNEAYLRHLCEEGAKWRYGELTPEVRERMEHELSVIKQTGFINYFLIVHDFIKHAIDLGIPVTARGSGVGSFVAYVMGITHVDPIEFDLLFERFLNPERIGMPDLDVDFCADRREEVIKYVREKYGEKSVSQIITFGTMKAKAVLRDVGRVMDIPLARVNDIVKLVGDKLGITLDEALGKEPKLQELYDSDPTIKKLFDIARKLEGLARHSSIHAAGVVIADVPLTTHMPICKMGDAIVSQWDGNTLADDIGILKADFLGVRKLTVLHTALRYIKETLGKEMTLEDIPYDDEPTFELLRKGDAKGLFQLETSEGMRDLVKKLAPEKFPDLVPLVALYRPGPLKSGMVDDFIDCRHGRKEPQYPHPKAEPILKETYGVILYQEQVMRIANRLGGFSLSEADLLRKAMGKKKPEIMAKYKDQFVKGCMDNDIDEKTAVHIWDLMEYFSGYGFNKSHSAAYAGICYQTAYLKANYPTQYMAALLTCESSDTDKVVEYMDDCKKRGIEVLPPCVNESGHEFTIVGERTIRFGLSAIKGVGGKAIEAITAARGEDGAFKSIFDFCERIDTAAVNKGVIETLVKSGAMDCFGAKRSQLAAVVEKAVHASAQVQRDRARKQMTFFDAFQASAAQSEEAADTSLPDIEEWPDRERLAFEKETLGLFISGHPLDRYRHMLSRFADTTAATLPEREEDTWVTLAGMFTQIRPRTTGKGDPMANYTLEDMDGIIRGVAWKEACGKYPDLLVEDKIVVLRGTVDCRMEDPQVIIEELYSIEEAHEKLPAKVNVVLPMDSVKVSGLDPFEKVLRTHYGELPVVLTLDGNGSGKVSIAIGDQFRVKPSAAFCRDIEALAEAARVAFEAKPANGNGRRRWKGKRK